MTHLWVRAEQRPHEDRTGLMPEGARALIAAGFRVTVEESRQRAIGLEGYRAAGCAIAPEGSWPDAPHNALIFGLKELPEDGSPLIHRHIMFGHAYKDQPAGRVLLDRFQAGGGMLYDLEYLVDDNGRRIAAFGYWAGFAGAAVALKCWVAQDAGDICGPVTRASGKAALVAELGLELAMAEGDLPDVLIIGALGRVGTGAADLCRGLGLRVTLWDIAETVHGGPFPEVLEHEVFLNCILARPGCPVFVPADALAVEDRALCVIGDIACDPMSEFSPIKVYDRVTDWASPALRVHDDPPLDVMAIDNLPSLLPLEASQDFSAQLLPHLLTLDALATGVWTRAAAEFVRHATPKG